MTEQTIDNSIDGGASLASRDGDNIATGNGSGNSGRGERGTGGDGGNVGGGDATDRQSGGAVGADTPDGGTSERARNDAGGASDGTGGGTGGGGNEGGTGTRRRPGRPRRDAGQTGGEATSRPILVEQPGPATFRTDADEEPRRTRKSSKLSADDVGKVLSTAILFYGVTFRPQFFLEAYDFDAKELSPITDPAARLLERLPIKYHKMVKDASDPLLLVAGLLWFRNEVKYREQVLWQKFSAEHPDAASEWERRQRAKGRPTNANTGATSPAREGNNGVSSSPDDGEFYSGPQDVPFA